MAGEETLESCSGYLESCKFFGRVASSGYGFVKQSFRGLEGAEDLEEGQEIFTCSRCKSIEAVVDQIGMGVFVKEEANSKAFWCSAIIYIRDVWYATTNREPSYDWSRGFVEVRRYRKRLCLLGRCERPFYKKSFGVG